MQTATETSHLSRCAKFVDRRFTHRRETAHYFVCGFSFIHKSTMPNPISAAYMNVLGPDQLISSQINKVDSGLDSLQEGPADVEFDELELTMTDEELMQLKTQWELNSTEYSENYAIKQRQEVNKTFYLGRQGMTSLNKVGIADNIIFEAVETFLPAALSKNPEPVVYSSNDTQGVDLSNDVKTMLQNHADTLNLRLKLKKVIRHWLIYLTGCTKTIWNKKTNDIDLVVVFPQNLLLDKDGHIDDKGEYEGKFIGERHTDSAAELIQMFPKKKAFIDFMVDGKLGTDCVYTEWSTPLYCFYTFKDEVLGKYRNPDWNYDFKQGNGEYDEEGNETQAIVPGKNHFTYPKLRYRFFSVFNLGEHPHDETTLIEQNIPNQNLVTDRNLQIKQNLQNANNGIAVSGEHFNKEDAKEANDMVRAGKGIFVPSGDVRTAIMRLPAPDLPNGVFQELNDKRNELRSIFGTQGISAAAPSENDTVRGKILNQQYASDRIGGGISDQLAQLADSIFNQWVQMYYVYYDEPHVASILGPARATQYVQLQRDSLIQMEAKLTVSVAADSMKPKDELSEMNLATDMFTNGSLDPLSYYEALKMPDPVKLLTRLAAYQSGGAAALLQTTGQGQQMGMQPQGQPGGAPPGGPDQNVAGNPQSQNLSETPASDSLGRVPISGTNSAMPT